MSVRKESAFCAGNAATPSAASRSRDIKRTMDAVRLMEERGDREGLIIVAEHIDQVLAARTIAKGNIMA